MVMARKKRLPEYVQDAVQSFPATSFKHVLVLCNSSFVKQWEGRNLTRNTVEAVKGFTEPPEADLLSAKLVLF